MIFRLMPHYHVTIRDQSGLERTEIVEAPSLVAAMAKFVTRIDRPDFASTTPGTSPSSRVVRRLTEFFDAGTKFFALAAPMASVLGFLVFFRYCCEISFFPELTLSGTGGLVGASFAFAILFALYIFVACYIPSLMFGTAVWRWEGVRRHRLALMRQVTIWMTVASIILPLGFVKLVASRHKFWHRHSNYVPWLVALVIILILWSLLQVIGTRWINVISRKAETAGNTPVRLSRA